MTTLHFREFQPGDELAFGRDRLASVATTGFVIDAGTADGPRDTLTVNPHDPRPLTVTRAGTTYTPWRYQRWAVVDTETTGLAETDKIVELAIVTMRFGQVIDTFSTLVNPGVPIPPEATAVHGITDAMVANSPTFGAIAAAVTQKINACVAWLGYNAVGYDESVLVREGIALGVPLIDPYPLVKSSHVGGQWKSPPSNYGPHDDFDEAFWSQFPQRKPKGKHSLARAIAELVTDKPPEDMGGVLHRAEYDAWGCGAVAWACRRLFGMDAAETSARLRQEAVRQSASSQVWREKMAARDAGKREAREKEDASRRARLDRLMLALEDATKAMNGAREHTTLSLESKP